jgi:hypothetical protein
LARYFTAENLALLSGLDTAIRNAISVTEREALDRGSSTILQLAAGSLTVEEFNEATRHAKG